MEDTTTTAAAAAFTKHEQFSYVAPWQVNQISWSVRPDRPFRLALGSFVEEYSNKVQVVHLDKESGAFVVDAELDHPYPATKLQWNPDRAGSTATADLLATAGDAMRLWEMRAESSGGGARQRCVLSGSKSPEHCAPLTSFDWNQQNADVIGTSSVDTTCTIWSVETQKVKTQLIAHDKEVYDMAFASYGTEIFASVGADGSVRMFDLRSLEHSTIIYESQDLVPLLRLAWNRQDSNYLATFALDASKVVVLDIRVPSMPAAELAGHHLPVNAFSWAPHSSCHICTAAEDKQALIWDLSAMPKPVEFPILHYEAEAEINSL
jgi:WD repeat-containing protein 68